MIKYKKYINKSYTLNFLAELLPVFLFRFIAKHHAVIRTSISPKMLFEESKKKNFYLIIARNDIYIKCFY